MQITDAIESTPNQAPVFQSDGNLPFQKPKFRVRLQRDRSGRRHPHLFSCLRRRRDFLKSSCPPACLHSSPLLTSSRPRTIIPTTHTRPRFKSQTVTLRSPSTLKFRLSTSRMTREQPIHRLFSTLSLEPLFIAENAAIGTVTGHLHASDPDPNDTLTFPCLRSHPIPFRGRKQRVDQNGFLRRLRKEYFPSFVLTGDRLFRGFRGWQRHG